LTEIAHHLDHPIEAANNPMNFREIRDMHNRQCTIPLERFVDDAARCGISLDELIEMTHGCVDGTEFLGRFKTAATMRGVVITGLEQ
jgi:hypothetical protein